MNKEIKETMTRRPVDENNRCVLPKHLTNNIFHTEDDEKYFVDFFCTEDAIIIKRAEPPCVFCHNHDDNMLKYKGRAICPSCFQDLIKENQK